MERNGYLILIRAILHRGQGTDSHLTLTKFFDGENKLINIKRKQMKVKSTFSLIIGLLLTINYSCVQAQSTFTDKEATVILKNFYTTYMTEFSEISPSRERKLNTIKSKYCTEVLLKKLPVLAERTDSDPLLKAQDSDVAWLKTLMVEKDLKKPHTYIVSYVDGGNNKYIIHLTLVKQNESIKIASVW